MTPSRRYSLRAAWAGLSVAAGLAFTLTLDRGFFAFLLPLVLAVLGASVGRSRLRIAMLGATLGASTGFACAAVVLVSSNLGGVFDGRDLLQRDVALANYLQHELGTLTVFFSVLSLTVGVAIGTIVGLGHRAREEAEAARNSRLPEARSVTKSSSLADSGDDPSGRG